MHKTHKPSKSKTSLAIRPSSSKPHTSKKSQIATKADSRGRKKGHLDAKASVPTSTPLQNAPTSSLSSSPSPTTSSPLYSIPGSPYSTLSHSIHTTSLASPHSTPHSLLPHSHSLSTSRRKLPLAPFALQKRHQGGPGDGGYQGYGYEQGQYGAHGAHPDDFDHEGMGGGPQGHGDPRGGQRNVNRPVGTPPGYNPSNPNQPKFKPPSRQQIYAEAAKEGMYDPNDRDAFPRKSLDSLDDVLQKRYGPGMGPYTPLHAGIRHEMNQPKDVIYDHTLPKGPKPSQWSFPADAPAPQGYKKYEAADGTWWRQEGEKSDHESYAVPEPAYIFPEWLGRTDRRKKYYTYMHRNAIDHINPGRPAPSYRSQWYWFWINKMLDRIDTFFRVVIHITRPVWILSKIMFRIPEFTIKFLLQVKVEIFRYIERRWGAPDKRDPEVYKFIPGMLEATYNGGRVMMDYLERWGVRDPDVGAWMRKHHVFDFTTWLIDSAENKLQAVKTKHYQAYLKEKKEKAQKEVEKSDAYKLQQVDQALKTIIGTHQYTVFTGLVPTDPQYGRPYPELMSEVKSRPHITESDGAELFDLREHMRALKLEYPSIRDVTMKRVAFNAKPTIFENVVDLIVGHVHAQFANDAVVEARRNAVERQIQIADKITQFIPAAMASSLKYVKQAEKLKEVGVGSVTETLHDHFDALETFWEGKPDRLKLVTAARKRECGGPRPPKPQPAPPKPPAPPEGANAQGQSSTPPPTDSAAFAMPASGGAAFAMPAGGDSGNAFAMPASGSSAAFAMPASGSSAAFAMPASGSDNAFAMPASGSAFAMPASGSDTAFAMPASGSAFAMPASGSDTAFAMPASGSSTAFAMPASSSSTSAFAMPASGSDTAFAMPASGSSNAFAMPATGSDNAFAMPASGSSTAFAMPASSSDTAFAMPASGSSTAFAMPASGSDTAFAMPATGSSTAFAMPATSAPSKSTPPPKRPTPPTPADDAPIIML